MQRLIYTAARRHRTGAPPGEAGRFLTRRLRVCCIEEDDEDDDEIEYGRLYIHNLAEESKVNSPKELGKIWPHWSEGVPTKLRDTLGSPAFVLGAVSHDYREYYETLELKWSDPHLLSSLRPRRNGLLPSSRYSSQWSGVYRMFLPDTTINRFCGNDPTGTLYLGKAGTGAKSWSILQTRIRAIAKGEHHATRSWDYIDVIRQKHPWESLAVDWAYTGERTDYKGDTILAAPLAETWLLRCYNDSYGEYPPLNQEG
jgi:hypothetical protein